MRRSQSSKSACCARRLRSGERAAAGGRLGGIERRGLDQCRYRRRPLRPGLTKSSRARASCSTRVVAVVNDGVVLRERARCSRCARSRRGCAAAERRAARRGRAALAGARPAGARGDPGAARRSRRHQGLGRAGQRRAGRHRQAAEHHARAAAGDSWRAEGIDYAEYRSELRREIARQMLRQRDVVQRIIITPRELDQYLRAREEDRLGQPTNTTSSHILIAVAQDANPAQLAQATQAGARHRCSARAAARTSASSRSPTRSETALEGGALGWRKGTELPTFLADVIARMKPGEVSDVHADPQRLSHREAQRDRAPPAARRSCSRCTCAISCSSPPRSRTTPPCSRSSRTCAIRSSPARKSSRCSPRPTRRIRARRSTAATWAGRSPMPSCRNSPPSAASLKEGEISQPFHTQYGWHIVQMLGRRDFDNTSRRGARARLRGAARQPRRGGHGAVAAADPRRILRRAAALMPTRCRLR